MRRTEKGRGFSEARLFFSGISHAIRKEEDNMTGIQEILFDHQDTKYADFAAKLIPTVPREKFIGIRTPEYKKIVKELPEEETVEAFLKALPHAYQEENILHSVLINRMKDFESCLAALEKFLPYVDNWAVCDGIQPKVFLKHLPEIKKKIPEWIASEATYTRRFGMHMLMSHFLEDLFDETLLSQPAELRSEEYYVNMMTAWLFAEALTKQWDAAVPELFFFFLPASPVSFHPAFLRTAHA